MSYATRSDLVMIFGESEVNALLDRDRDGLDDPNVLNDALTFAQSHIDGYLREHYSVPLSSPPRNIVGFACDIARYRLYQDQPTELVQNRYDVACFFLKDVARGLVQLDVIPVEGVESASRIAYTQPASIFTRMLA